MRNSYRAGLLNLPALAALGMIMAVFAGTAGGQSVRNEAPVPEKMAPAPITPNTPPPFAMRISGAEEPFLPDSAWHCPEYPINGRMPVMSVDQPDTPAIFFRDANGNIHMFAMGPFNYAFVGRSVDELKENCHSIYPSHYDENPKHFEYQEWIRGTYTLDGTHVYAVSSNEFYCRDRMGPVCDYRVLIGLHSSDGGYTFRDDPMPERVIATIPYEDLLGTVRGPGKATGVGDNSNIIRNPNDGYFYMSAIDLSARKTCMLRSQDLHNWVAWDGNSFSVQLNNPKAYQSTPETYHCAGGGLGSLQYLSRYNLFLGSFRDGGDLAFKVSSDLVHWSAPEGIGLPVPIGRRNDGNTAWEYPSVFDPETSSTNFDVINPGDKVYLLVVKDTPSNDGGRLRYGRDRELVRFPLSLTPADSDKDAVDASPVTFAPKAGSYHGAQTVAMACTTPSSVIYYTTNGEPPAMDTFFTKQYTEPLQVAQSTKISAVCLSTGYRPSPVRAAQYTIGGR